MSTDLEAVAMVMTVVLKMAISGTMDRSCPSCALPKRPSRTLTNSPGMEKGLAGSR